MSKFQKASDAILGLFAAPWSIPTVPQNFTGAPTSVPYLRVSPLFEASEVNSESLRGVLMVEIFVSRGDGPQQAMIAADALNDLLNTKEIQLTDNAVIQTGRCSLSPLRPDPDSKILSRAVYSIPFNYFCRF